MTKKYRVTLTDEEREYLNRVINTGKHSAQKRKRAQALLLADGEMTDSEIAERVGIHRRGVEELRQRFVEDGFEVTLEGTNTKQVSYETIRQTLKKSNLNRGKIGNGVSRRPGTANS
jgi:DNA-binding CsgD family transcriptional regulator